MLASSCQAVISIIVQACVLFRDAGCKHSQAEAPAAAGASAPTPRRRQAAAKRRATSSDDQDFQPPPPKQQSSPYIGVTKVGRSGVVQYLAHGNTGSLQPRPVYDVNSLALLMQYKRTGRFEGEHSNRFHKCHRPHAVCITCHPCRCLMKHSASIIAVCLRSACVEQQHHGAVRIRQEGPPAAPWQFSGRGARCAVRAVPLRLACWCINRCTVCTQARQALPRLGTVLSYASFFTWIVEVPMDCCVFQGV